MRPPAEQREFSSPSWAWWAVAALTVWAGILRWPGVTAWWFNPDEAMHYAVATAEFDSVPRLIGLHAHPPLYFWILWSVARWSASAVALRLPALVAGIALVPALFLLVRRHAGTLAGVIAALLTCLSPGAIVVSQVMRPYALQLLCLAIGLLGLSSYLQDGRRNRLVLYVIASACAL